MGGKSCRNQRIKQTHKTSSPWCTGLSTCNQTLAHWRCRWSPRKTRRSPSRKLSDKPARTRLTWPSSKLAGSWTRREQDPHSVRLACPNCRSSRAYPAGTPGLAMRSTQAATVEMIRVGNRTSHPPPPETHSWSGGRSPWRNSLPTVPARLVQCSICARKGTVPLTYLPIIFFKACDKIFQGNTFTSFSMFRGFGAGKPMMTLKNSSLSGFALETVSGRNPSRLRRIRFFSSTVKRTPTSDSRR